MTVERLEAKGVHEFLSSLLQPVHVLLLYGDPTELDHIEPQIGAEKLTAHASQKPERRSYTIDAGGFLVGWVINRIGEDLLQNASKLIEYEKEIKEKGVPPRMICAYHLKNFLQLDAGLFVEILSLHDYVLFTRFEEGMRLTLEVVEEAMEVALGRSGSEMIYRFANNMGVERDLIPYKLRTFRRVLQELLGIGANFMELFIFRTLYNRLRSNPQVVCVDG